MLRSVFNKRLVIVWIIGLFPGLAAAAPELVDKVVAVVDDDIITKRELNERIEISLQAFLQQNTGPVDRTALRAEMTGQVLDSMIAEKLIGVEIEKNSAMLTVGEADVARAIEQVLQMNNITMEQLRSVLYRQGMTESEYRGKLKEDMARARLIQMKVQSKVRVTDAEVDRMCQESTPSSETPAEVCASHIMFMVGSELDRAAAKEKADRVYSLLQAGGDFAALAQEHSDNPDSPDGSLGCFPPGELGAAFDAVAFRIPKGSFSGVVETSRGYEIILVTDRKSNTTNICSDPRGRAAVLNELRNRKMQTEMERWVKTLRESTFVDVRL